MGEDLNQIGSKFRGNRLVGCGSTAGDPARKLGREIAVGQQRSRKRVCALAPVETKLLKQRQVLPVANADLPEESTQTIALVDDGTEKRVEPAFACNLQYCGKSLGKLGIGILRRKRDHFPARLANEGSFHLRVEHLEMPRNIGLQRELVQNGLAEGMNGLDLQTTRRFKRARKQLTCQPELPRVRLDALKLRNLPREIFLRKHRPARKVCKHTVCHVGGCRARIGETQDAGRIDTAQQQPDHAAGKNMRLARAGIGRDPGGNVGRRGGGLRNFGVFRDDERAAHSPSPPLAAPSPPADHSSTRAK